MSCRRQLIPPTTPGTAPEKVITFGRSPGSATMSTPPPCHLDKNPSESKSQPLARGGMKFIHRTARKTVGGSRPRKRIPCMSAGPWPKKRVTSMSLLTHPLNVTQSEQSHIFQPAHSASPSLSGPEAVQQNITIIASVKTGGKKQKATFEGRAAATKNKKVKKVSAVSKTAFRKTLTVGSRLPSESTGKSKGAIEIWSGLPDEPLPGCGWPTGWTKKIFERNTGASKGHTDKYWYSPKTQKKFRSMVEVQRFLTFLGQCDGNEDVAWKTFKGKS